MKYLFVILFVSLAIASCKDRQKVQSSEGEVPVIAISCQKKTGTEIVRVCGFHRIGSA